MRRFREIWPTAILSLLVNLNFPAQAVQVVDQVEEVSPDIEDIALGEGIFLVVVWASWSPKSHAVPDILADLAKNWSGRAQTVGVLFQENPDDLDFSGSELEVPIYWDSSGGFSRKWDVKTLPFLLIFRDGKPVFAGKLPNRPNPLIRRALSP